MLVAKSQLVDLLTKIVSIEQHHRLLSNLGVLDVVTTTLRWTVEMQYEVSIEMTYGYSSVTRLEDILPLLFRV